MRAAATLTAFTNALAVALFGLVPGFNAGDRPPSSLWSGCCSSRARSCGCCPGCAPSEIQLRELSFLIGLLVVFVIQLIVGLRLDGHAHDSDALQTICILVDRLLPDRHRARLGARRRASRRAVELHRRPPQGRGHARAHVQARISSDEPGRLLRDSAVEKARPAPRRAAAAGRCARRLERPGAARRGSCGARAERARADTPRATWCIAFYADLAGSAPASPRSHRGSSRPAGSGPRGRDVPAATTATSASRTSATVALPLGLVDVKVAAIDDDWSGLRLVWRRELRDAPAPPTRSN